ncbi:hypothetical protein NEIRO03_2314 [Nematocida sp. AWRm78]|nr:hypothetical protein NEIRO02_2295 [Nematocida sp. AWRm79]KAI5186545.1 hypothetical protein NEIRO03_2314 [Nematocida sp. AWRm78]
MEETQLEIKNMEIDFICIYNHIQILVIGAYRNEENTPPVTDKAHVDNCIRAFVIDGNDSHEEIQKKWLELPYTKYYDLYNLVYIVNIVLSIFYLLSLRIFQAIEEKSVHALSNLIVTHTHPLIHEYVLTGNFFYTLLQIVSGTYIIMGFIKSICWMYKKSKDAYILNISIFGLLAIICIYTVYLVIIWLAFLILNLVEDYSVISDIIVYGCLFFGILKVYIGIHNIYTKNHVIKHIGEYIAIVLNIILLIMSGTAIIYTFSDNILDIIECIK